MRTYQVLSLLVFVMSMILAPAVMADDAASSSTRQAIEAILDRPDLHLVDLFRLAELTNPSLAVARTGVLAESGRLRQAGLYPNPELELEVEELSLDDSANHTLRVALTQPLPIGGRRGAAVAAARARLAATKHQLLQDRREALRRVHQLWAEQLYFREADTVFAELLTVADSTLAIARTRFETRAAPESHVTKAMLEVYELEVAQQQLDQQRARGSAEFAAFFGGVTVPLDRLAGTLDPDPDEPTRHADPEDFAATHPALLAARMEIAATQADLKEAKAARIPDLNVFVAYGNARPLDENFVEAGVALPLPLFHRNQGRLDETRSLHAQAQHQARIVENALAVELAAALQRHEQKHEQLDTVTGRIVPAAERGLDQALEAYRVGRLMFLELVDAQRTFANARLRALDIRRDLALAEADLLSLLGAGPYADPGNVDPADADPADIVSEVMNPGDEP